MAGYTNAASFRPNFDFRANPLAGYGAGVEMGMMQSLNDRDMRDSDQSYLEQLHKFDMEKAADPAKLAELENKRGANQEEIDIRNTGLTRQAAESKIKTQLGADETSMQEQRLKQHMNRGALISQMNEEFKADPISPMSNPTAVQKRWDDWKEKLAKVGMSIGDTPDPEFLNALPGKATAYQNTIPHLNELAKVFAQNKGHLDVEDAKNAGALQRERENNATKEKIEGEKVRVKEAAQADAKKDEALNIQLVARISKDGVSPADAQQIKSLIQRQVEKEMQHDIGFLQAQANHTEAEYINKKIAEKQALWERQVPSLRGKLDSAIEQGERDNLVKSVTPPKATASAAVAKPTSEAEYKALKPGTPYYHPDDPPGSKPRIKGQ